jgi:pimeloyl-ACP methyl ester carboxylesterase
LKKYPEMCRALLLLDPLSPNDGLAKLKLVPRIYKRSGFEKAKTIVYMKYLAHLRILPILKSLIMKSPPFYYFKTVSAESKEIIWQSMLRSSFYRTMTDEYSESHKEENLIELRGMRNTFTGKVVVLYHDPKVIIDEIVQYGGLSVTDAQMVDDIWKELIGEYCDLSSHSEFSVIENATHYIHQSRPDIVIENCLKAIEETASI